MKLTNQFIPFLTALALFLFIGTTTAQISDTSPTDDKCLADLRLNNTTAPSTGTCGQNINLSTKVKNQGYEGAGVSYLGVFLSTDNTLSNDDIKLTELYVLALSAGSDCIKSASVPLPSGIQGDFKLIFVADLNDQVCESNEGNNKVIRSIWIDCPKPDLIPINQSSTPKEVCPGETIWTSVTVKNQGFGAAGASTLKYYLSTDCNYSNDDIFLGSDAVGNLAGGGTSHETADLTIPVGTPAGWYCIIFRVDAHDTVDESDENNNIACTEFDLKHCPDLVPLNATVNPTIICAGETTWTAVDVKNIGTSKAGASTLKYYLSSNCTLSSDDRLLGSDPVGQLDPGDISHETADFTLDADFPKGDYYILFVVDATDAVDETNENNNVACKAIWTKNCPDLRPINAEVNPTTLCAGETFWLDVDIKNFGPSNAAASTLKYYLSDNCTVSSDDVLIGTDGVKALTPGQIDNETADYTIPANFPAGDYYVLFVADANDDLEEKDETNNIACKPIWIRNCPDLTPINADVTPTTLCAGETLWTDVDIKNLGPSKAAASTLKYYLSDNCTVSDDDILLGTDGVNPLNPGATDNETGDFVIPADLAAGDYYILFVADANDVLDEKDETNNIACKPIWVRSCPDLTPINASVTPTNVCAGETIWTAVDVKNIGVSTAGVSKLKYYLSKTCGIGSSGDIYLGQDHVGALAPGASSHETADLVIPSSVDPGDYYIVFVVDANGQVDETDETNNIACKQVWVKECIDLVPTNTTVTPDEICPASTIWVGVDVKNIGVNTAGASVVKYYLSTDCTFSNDDQFLGHDPVGSLAPGASSHETGDFFIPPNQAPGEYFVLFVVDANDQVDETNEGNNVGCEKLTIKACPDLIPETPTVGPSNACPGSYLHVTVSVKNYGLGHAGASTLKYYLSTDCALSNDDILLGSDPVSALAPNAGSYEAEYVQLPHNLTPGLYCVLYIADADGVVDEFDETNNLVCTEFNVLPDSDCGYKTEDLPAAPKAEEETQRLTPTEDDPTLEGPSLLIAPNPANSFVRLEYAAGSEAIISGVLIFDNNGRLVTEYQPEDKTGSIQVDSSNFPVGTYTVVMVSDRGKKVAKKLVIVH